MDVVVTLHVTVSKDEDNDAEAWHPSPAQVGREISDRLLLEDLDTGWHISGVQWGGS